ncbi:hypothetical protein [Cupriavidus basilensis]
MSAMNRTKTAVIPAIAHAAARDALVGLQYQWAVDLGIETADGCLQQLGQIPLHVFVPGCAMSFRASLQRAAAEAGQAVPAAELAAAGDAFVSGLLGRLQQYLLAGFGGRVNSATGAATHPH